MNGDLKDGENSDRMGKKEKEVQQTKYTIWETNSYKHQNLEVIQLSKQVSPSHCLARCLCLDLSNERQYRQRVEKARVWHPFWNRIGNSPP